MNFRTHFEHLRQDLAYALRTMAASPLFTSMAVLSLALGIGANTAIYSFMEAVLLRPLPVSEPQRLVVVQWRSKDFPAVAHSFNGSNYSDKKTGMVSGNLPYPAFEELAKNRQFYSSVFGFSYAGPVNLNLQGQAHLGTGQYVTGDFFRGLGVAPAAGRLLTEDDDRATAPVTVVSFQYARQHFPDAEHAVGQKLALNGQAFTIVGVTPRGFSGVDPRDRYDLYVPMRSQVLLHPEDAEDTAKQYTEANSYWINVMARLRPGVTLAQAQQPSAAAFHAFVDSTAKTDKERSDLPALFLAPGAAGLDGLRREYRQPLYVLMTLVGLILAIACANIANLLLARSTARRREMAVRLSLGAGRARVIRQLLTESLLLASCGAALGVLLAMWGIQLLTSLIGNGRENFSVGASLNWNVLAVTIGIALFTGLLFGLAPALQSTRVDLVSALKQTRAGDASTKLRRGFLRVSLSQALVTAQIAISLLLLVAAGLFLRTISNLGSVELGFNRENVLMFRLDARQGGYADQALARFYENVHDQLHSIPGVRNVTESNYSLVSGSLYTTTANVPGAIDPKVVDTAIMRVGPSFFTTMQIPILIGRELDAHDETSGARVAVVNQVFARKYFGDQNPIGRRVGVGRKSTPDIEIVGVSKTARLQSLKQDVPAVIYYPYGMTAKQISSMTYEVRASGDPMAMVESVRRLVRQLDPRVPLSNVTTQSRVIDQTISKERTFATLCTWFAGLAVLIACVGLYGTMAYSVARKTNEIGVRLALGAKQGRLVWMVLREVMLMSAAGLAIGIPAALALSHLVESYLFGMKAKDPLVLLGAPLVLLLAAIAAGYGPARRASRIDPWNALRNE